MDQAKTRAFELPDDLMKGVRQASQKSTGRTQKSTNRIGSKGRRQTTSASKTTRKTPQLSSLN